MYGNVLKSIFFQSIYQYLVFGPDAQSRYSTKISQQKPVQSNVLYYKCFETLHSVDQGSVIPHAE